MFTKSVKVVSEMKRTENECVSCGLPCMHEACPNYRVTRYYCDECKEEGVLYEFDGQELCSECILKHLPKVAGSDYYSY